MARGTRKRLLVSLGLALAVSVLLSVAYSLTFLSTAQVQSHDFLFKARTGERARASAIVGIDQRSYRELLPQYGPLANWPRTLYARALDALQQAGPRVVVFDIFFDDPQPDDEALAAAIKRAGDVLMPAEAQGPRDRRPRPGVAQEFDLFVRPPASLREAAIGEGLANVTTDQDAAVRSLPLFMRAGDEDLPALALAAVARYIRRPRVIDAPPSEDRVYAAGRAIPVVSGGRMLINFLGPPSSVDSGGPFTIISFVDVVNGTFDPRLVDDKIILIGVTIRGIDEYTTPSTSLTRMWGVEVLGNAVETILTQRYLVPAPAGITVSTLFLLALVAALLVGLWRPLFAALGTLGLLALYLLLALVLVDNGLLVNLIYPPAGLLVGFAVVLTYRVVFEQAEQRIVRGVMARYLSPAVSQWVLRDPDRLRLGGETREMTVLFSDVRGFTTLSHAMEPQALTALLNEYMTAMTDVVFKHDGVLDKYIGDAIMAFWNAPIEQPDHARRACETALDMITTLHQLQADWARRGVPKLELGIGINTGPMVVGNMGSRQRLEYTVLGDTVNVASRLEGLSKEYGTRVVIGEGTREAAGDAYIYRFLDVVAVKGRSEPLRVYEVASRAAQLDPGRAAFLGRFDRGIELYRARRWADAAGLFGELLASAPDDGPCALYFHRSNELLVSPPAADADWDGVFVAKTK
ncbi:MAG TPA: adenylate/guanylate cyclase domain-containing protein [Chloroflexota bacterium]|nr:adenylate/guanylate cyclase domain-containing protein [Chloroflexota bacterium]